MEKFKYHVGFSCGPGELIEPHAFSDNVIFFGITSKSSSEILSFCDEQIAKISEINFTLSLFNYEPLNVSDNESQEKSSQK